MLRWDTASTDTTNVQADLITTPSFYTAFCHKFLSGENQFQLQLLNSSGSHTATLTDCNKCSPYIYFILSRCLSIFLRSHQYTLQALVSKGSMSSFPWIRGLVCKSLVIFSPEHCNFLAAIQINWESKTRIRSATKWPTQNTLQQRKKKEAT